MNRALIGLAAIFVAGCTSYSPCSPSDYFWRHPEFPHRTPARETHEYQIAIHRPWRNAVYVIAGEGNDGGYIGYSIDKRRNGGIEPLSYKRLSKSQWQDIDAAFKRIGFFEWDVPCWEKGYLLGKMLVHDKGECGEVIGGGLLSFQAVSPAERKAVLYPFVEDDELSKFTYMMLGLAGVQAQE